MPNVQEGDAPSVSALVETMAELAGPQTCCLVSFECRDDALRAQLLQAGHARFQQVSCKPGVLINCQTAVKAMLCRHALEVCSVVFRREVCPNSHLYCARLWTGHAALVHRQQKPCVPGTV